MFLDFLSFICLNQPTNSGEDPTFYLNYSSEPTSEVYKLSFQASNLLTYLGKDGKSRPVHHSSEMNEVGSDFETSRFKLSLMGAVFGSA